MGPGCGALALAAAWLICVRCARIISMCLLNSSSLKNSTELQSFLAPSFKPYMTMLFLLDLFSESSSFLLRASISLQFASSARALLISVTSWSESL